MLVGLAAFACGEQEHLPSKPVSLNGGTLHYDDTGCYAVYPTAVHGQRADTVTFQCGAVIIGFADSTRWSDIRPLLRELGIIAIYDWFPMTRREDSDLVLRVLIEVPVGKEKQTIERARQHPHVKHAEPNHLIRGGLP